MKNNRWRSIMRPRTTKVGIGALVVVLGLAATPTPAFAHVAIEGVGGFWGGLLHPLLVPQHALALVVLGLFVGQQRERRMACVVFAVALLAGLAAIASAVGATPAATVLLATTMLAGVLVAVGRLLPGFIGWALAAVTGVSVGLDSPPQAITIAEGDVMLAGTAVGALLLLLAVVAAASVAHHPVAKLAVRILGSWIAASAMLMLAVDLSR
jgi:urease accessory protein